MNKFRITNVGIDLDSVSENRTTIKGKGDIYSEDIGGDQVEYVDPMTFNYNVETDTVKIKCDKVFNEYLEEISEILIENIKLNIL